MYLQAKNGCKAERKAETPATPRNVSQGERICRNRLGRAPSNRAGGAAMAQPPPAALCAHEAPFKSSCFRCTSNMERLAIQQLMRMAHATWVFSPLPYLLLLLLAPLHTEGMHGRSFGRRQQHASLNRHTASCSLRTRESSSAPREKGRFRGARESSQPA